MKKLVILVVIGVFLLGVIGCASMSKKQKGAIIGAGAGALAGGVIGKQAGSTAIGAILGAVVGGAAGAYIGNYMDKQAEEMQQDLQGAKIERIGEGIKITFDSGILFDVNKSTLRLPAQVNLQNLAGILNKYPDTEVLIEGHTDSTGPEDYNMDLSMRRSQSVANFLAGIQVSAARFHIMGYGEAQPVASNETTDGRQQNRRVDIAVYANDKLKKAAEAKQG
jgi:outer membrane protein OmpA-like peptidoglycan-associated protein